MTTDAIILTVDEGMVDKMGYLMILLISKLIYTWNDMIEKKTVLLL